jgi:hypothetical protein
VARTRTLWQALKVSRVWVTFCSSFSVSFGLAGGDCATFAAFNFSPSSQICNFHSHYSLFKPWVKNTVEFTSMNLVARRSQKIENNNLMSKANSIVIVIFDKYNIIMHFFWKISMGSFY